MSNSHPRPVAQHLDDADTSQTAEFDAFISRNRDALEESIERSRAEIAADVCDARSIGDIISEGRRRRRTAS